MKVYIGPYVSRWICKIHQNWLEWRYKDCYYNIPDDDQDRIDRFVECIDDKFQTLYNVTINKYLDNKKRNIKVKIHNYDVWSLDHTLAQIIAPSLKLLKDKKHGAPSVEYDDVPPHLRPSLEEIAAYAHNGTTDDKFFERWDWVLDEMIWAFDQIADEDNEDKFFDETSKSFMSEEYAKHRKRIENGTRLFGKYFSSLWD